MKEALYLEDSYLQEFDAVVESVKDEKYIILSRTAFYPNSGGQLYDTGRIIRKSDGKEFYVVFTGKFDGKISHELSEKGLNQGEEVHCILDWERRYKMMRMHTAAHLLSAAFNRFSGALITGNQLGMDRSRIDFSLEDFNREKIDEYVRRVNEWISEGREIKIYALPREEAMKIEGIVKLAGAIPPNVNELRVVEIKDIDIQADGGTHLRDISEVGRVVFLKAENKGRNNRRVYFNVE